MGEGVYCSTDGSWTAKEQTIQGTLNDEMFAVSCSTSSVSYKSGHTGWDILFEPTPDFDVQLALADGIETGRVYALNDLGGVGRGAPGYIQINDHRIENTDGFTSILDPYYSLRSMPPDVDYKDWRDILTDASLYVDFFDEERNALGGTVSFSGMDYYGELLEVSARFVVTLPSGSSPSSGYKFHFVDGTKLYFLYNLSLLSLNEMPYPFTILISMRYSLCPASVISCFCSIF